MGVTDKKLSLFFKFNQIFKKLIRYGLADLLILQLQQIIKISNKEYNLLTLQGLRFHLITTFVCKEGVVVDWRVNFFSAKKFMKNKETTARHHNLLPNQGHAVRIAMKLY